MAWAHSENDRGSRHDLVAHLTSVAELAAGFAAGFGAADLAYWAGLWHDVGKFHPVFWSDPRQYERSAWAAHEHGVLRA